MLTLHRKRQRLALVFVLALVPVALTTTFMSSASAAYHTASLDAPAVSLSATRPTTTTTNMVYLPVVQGGSGWSLFKPEVVTLTYESNSPVLTLDQSALWFNAQQSALLYRLVTGNFKITAKVYARKRTNPAQPPSSPVQLGGLMARDPLGVGNGGSENYVFIVVGYDTNDLSVETKNTVNSVSVYEGPTWGLSDAELRVCRLGGTFYLYKRLIGSATWTLATTYVRNDLPATLQVGANIYALNPVDLRVRFDELRIEDVADQTGCVQG